MDCKNTAGMNNVQNEISLMEREYKNQIILPEFYRFDMYAATFELTN
jgi:hypothetical protein